MLECIVRKIKYFNIGELIMDISKYANQIYNEVMLLYYRTVKKQEYRISKKYFQLLKDEKEQLLLVEELFRYNNFLLFSIATIWIKNNPNMINEEYLSFYERYLYEYIDSWDKCDQYCYRVLNPLIEKYPSLRSTVISWANSDLIYVKRASAVCLIHSSAEFSINVEFSLVEKVCKELMNEKHLHIQKAIGWLLKYSFITYPNETISLIEDSLNIMSATSFRYSLEKMPIETKEYLKALKNDSLK